MPTWKHQKQSLFHLCNGPLQTAALMPLVSSCHFLSLRVGGCILDHFGIFLFLKCLNHLKSLQTLGDGQDPYFARLEWRRSSLFRDEIHDLPRGTSQIPRPLYPLSIIIQCFSSMNIAQYNLVLHSGAKLRGFRKHNEVHVCDLLRERCTGFPCDERELKLDCTTEWMSNW